LTDLLAGRLKGASRLALMGVGSELRADDVAGLLVARKFAHALPERRDILVVEGHSAPENFTGEILRFEASHLVIVDCAELDAPPGTVRLFPVGDIGGLSSSTHSLPLSIIIAYLERYHSCETIVIGIQPKCLDFDGKPSEEALRAADRVADCLIGAANDMGKNGN
jgi:hydrogenase maturation protease HycI